MTIQVICTAFFALFVAQANFAMAQHSTPEKQLRKELVAEMRRELKAKSCTLARYTEVPFNIEAICPSILPEDSLEASRWKWACWQDVAEDLDVVFEWNKWVLRCITRPAKKGK